MKVTRKLFKQAWDQSWEVQVSWMMGTVRLGKAVC